MASFKRTVQRNIEARENGYAKRKGAYYDKKRADEQERWEKEKMMREQKTVVSKVKEFFKRKKEKTKTNDVEKITKIRRKT